MRHWFVRILWVMLTLMSLTGSQCNPSTRPEQKDEEPAPNSSEATTVLFIGNSLTGYNAMPRTLQKLAEYAGKSMTVTDFSIGGSKLKYHAQHESTLAAIRSKQWDVVILQGSSYNIAFSHLVEDLLPPIETLVQRIRANHSATEIVFFLDYALDKNVTLDGKVYYSPSEFIQMLIQGTKTVANHFNLPIAPVGAAWDIVLHGENDIKLYDTDGFHPSASGSYLMACVYFCTIFRETVHGNPYCATLPKADAAYLQEIAANTTLDQLTQWNIKPPAGN